ncbi:hypothetical protein FD15_GL002072 [Liquorilactobacillus sucicola DSM 21376 = JCM 15457]|uniref:Conjugal transfer protein n=1 Tax=Liquorilactobacillus sucicola DSM 21376 = JCM 15457 TaxID=1423806 RepID=A0A0R2DXV7_9LACO|nr:conjugal transfer protein [Liquorilactobacillus sucicola]KRN05516.1 hypothetical protein FD15_GL002072 [Liquorilactobacillus sucicola DSM 21376 = JCM 15457]
MKIIKIGDFEFKRRSKHQVNRIPRKKKKVNMKSAKIIVWITMVFIFSSGIFAFIKASNVAQTNQKLQAEVQTYQNKLEQASTNISGYSPLLDNYMQEFLATYLNYPNDTTEMDQRNKNLAVYYAINLNINDQAGQDYQTFDKASIQSVYNRKGVKIAQYYVEYLIHTTREETTEKNGKKETKTVEDVTQKSGYLNISFKVKNSKFTVVSYPYFSEKIDPVGHIGQLQSKYSKDKSVASSNLNNKAVYFTKSFLEKYAASKTNEMKFIMANPTGLAGEYEVSSVQNLHVYGTKNKPVVQCLVTFKQIDSDIKHTENVSLKLSKQRTTYFVDEFNHSIGGN